MITVKRILEITVPDIPEPPPLQCCHKVSEFTQEWRQRMEMMHGHKTDDYWLKKNAKRGHPTRCVCKAKYMVDGLPMCKVHAQQAVFQWVLQNRGKQ